MTKKFTWRLSKLPTPDELRELVKDKIVTQEEAREILFNQEEESERDEASLKSEIKFLRELIDKLTKDQNRVVEIIREVERPYIKWHWYQPYQNWGDSIVLCNGQITVSSSNGTYLTASSTSGNYAFTAIKTF
jgi:hypothetical protein